MIAAVGSHDHSWWWSGLFVSKTDHRKNHDAWRNSAVVEGRITVSKMCVAAASATGEPSADGDESAMVTWCFLCCSIMCCMQVRSVWVWLHVSFLVTRVVFRPNHVNLLAQKLVESQLWWPPKRDLNYPNTMVFRDGAVSPTWDIVGPTESTILVVFEH